MEVFLGAMHLLVLALMYNVMKKFSTILDRPYPWETRLTHLRRLMKEAYDQNNLTETMNEHLKVYKFQSQLVKFFMVFCVLQALLIGHILTEKSRWSKLGVAMAEHYKNFDINSRPNIDTSLGFEQYLVLFGYIFLVNLAAAYMFEKLYNAFQEHQLGTMEVFRYKVIPFIIIWSAFSYRMYIYCTQHEAAFMKLLEVEEAADIIV